MATFTTRVELHSASSKDYDVLHSAMEGQGFSRTVVGTSGTEYHLPEAEYYLQGDYDRDDVIALAKQAASQTKKKASILVTEGRLKWSGLPKVED